MSNTFFIGDTHFGHHKILEFESEARPFRNVEEMNEALISNWNGVVRKNDTVFHLGDVLFGRNNFHLLYRLNGLLKLVSGNHDQYPTEEYLKHFSKVHGSYRFDGNLLTHIPVHESQFYRFSYNIHGHLHSKSLDDKRYINVSCERIDLTPISYEELKTRM